MSDEVNLLAGAGERIVVSNKEELNMALAAATGGETIALRPGEYGTISLRERDFTSTVRIISDDPDSPAVFTGRLKLREVSNLSIESVDLIGSKAMPLYYERIRIDKSENIVIKDMKITGVLRDPDVDPFDETLTTQERI